MILVDGITKALFCNRFASPSELMSMTFRELLYFSDALIEHAKRKPGN